MNDRDSTLFGIAALQASLHSLMYIAKAGLASPKDMDVSLDGVTSTFEKLSPEQQATIQTLLDDMLVEIKRAAAENWKTE